MDAVTKTTEAPGAPSVAAHLNAGEACTINHSHNVVVTLDTTTKELIGVACVLVMGAAVVALVNAIVTFVQLVSQ